MIQPTRMRTIWMSLAILVLLVCGVSQLLARPATRVDPLDVKAEKMDARMKIDINNDSPYNPNSLCASCHLDFFSEWTLSMHYQSWREPIFQAVYGDYRKYMASSETYYTDQDVKIMDLKGRERRRALWLQKHNVPVDPSEPDKKDDGKKEVETTPIFSTSENQGKIGPQVHGDGLMREGIYDGKVHVNCLRCHAPGADFTKDDELTLENNIDGVFCDYCHTIIDYTESEGYVIFWSSIKQGPRMFGTTSSHAIEYSRLVSESRFCRGCHQYKNPFGTNVYDTYDEWFTSSYANPASTTDCQDCHFPTMQGRSSLRGDYRPDVHSHRLGGGHIYDWMVNTANVDLKTDVQGEELYIDVDVTNTKAGHNYPTSNGMRQLILVVRLKGASDETLWEESRIYEKVFGDSQGNPTFAPWEMNQVLSDTTLRPNEKRAESFVTTLPAGDESLYVTAQLFYRLTPQNQEVGTVYMPSPYRIDFSTQFIR
jgi:hypothetical protein